MLTKDIKVEFPHLAPNIFCIVDTVLFYLHEACHQRGKSLFFPLYTHYIYKNRKGYLENYRFLCNSNVFLEPQKHQEL